MINSLIRSNLKNFQPYSSARSLYKKGIFMDANENPFGSVINTNLDEDLNRYPDPYSLDLRVAIGKFLDVSEKNIFVGNGSDEAIDLLIRIFVENNEEIIVLEPTYGMYRVAAEVAGVAVKSCLLTSDFQIDMPSLLAKISPKTKIIFCCSPNNPTGTLVKPGDVESLCKNFNGIVVIDEAYIEFASQPSLVKKVFSLDNLVVLRTFSKAWGLAGIRVGYAVAQETTIKYLNMIKAPYNLNRISSKLAISALGQYEKMLKYKKLILAERKKLAKNLADLGFKVFPSESNFLLVYRINSSTIAKKLAEQTGIIVRDFNSNPLLRDCLRISVGTSNQNKLLIESLTKLL